MDPMIASDRAVIQSSEPSLVERARRGDAAAFESLMRDRIDLLFRTAWAILGSEADARDATQDACLSAWRQLPGLRDADAFDAWLHRVLVNACRMALRRRGRIREIAMEPADDRISAGVDDPASFGETEAIARAFDRLSLDHRTVLVLHHLQHRPIDAIATMLGIPPGTVKSRLHAARIALESSLAGERR